MRTNRNYKDSLFTALFSDPNLLMVLAEHQSTVNLNMALRLLLARLLEGTVKSRVTYSERRLPEKANPSLELEVKAININEGRNGAIASRCRRLLNFARGAVTERVP